MPSRICLAETEFPSWGGYGAYVENLATELTKQGNEVHVICGQSRCLGLHEKDTVHVHTKFRGDLPVISTLYFETSLGKKVKELKKEFDIQILHRNSPQAGPQWSLSDEGITEVITSHGTTNALVTSLIRKKAISSTSEFLETFFSHVLAKMERDVLRKCDQVIAVSEWTRSCILNMMKIDPVKIKVVYNGVSIDKFSRVKGAEEFFLKEYKIDAIANKIVLFVGRLHGVKGIKTLIRAIPRIIREVPDAFFVFVGRGNATIYKRLLHEAGVNALRYAFLGHVAHNYLPMIYSCADVCVLPSYYENCPTSLLEAMSCACPSVASNIGGIDEIVDNGRTGYFFEPGNEGELATKVLMILKDERLSKNMSKASREVVVEKFEWGSIAKQIIEIYKTLL